RFLHTSTLLADGSVLIAGGDSAFGALSAIESSAELYDPAMGRFAATGAMTTPRDGHTATLLPDGRVLLAGGPPAPAGTLASAELYDPSTGTFPATGSMATPRFFHTATLLADGRVLIAGGVCSQRTPGIPGAPSRTRQTARVSVRQKGPIMTTAITTRTDWVALARQLG